MAIIRSREPGYLSTQRALDPLDLVRDMLRWDPFRELSRLPEADFVFNPAFEVREAKDAYIFKADLPGVKLDELDISVTGNRLTVSGKREQEKRDEGERYYMAERVYGTFTRSFTLPDGADANAVKAELKEGVLTLVVPKTPEIQPKRIQVSAGGKGVEKAHA